MSWSKFRPWLAMALIFVLGVLTGAALTFSFRPDLPHLPGAQQMRDQWLAHLTKRLNLTLDQQTKIQPILVDAGNQIQALHHDEVNRIHQILANANAQISPLLTADQQAELKKMETEHHHDFSGHSHWGGAHGPQQPSAP